MPNSFFDCPLVPLLTVPKLGHAALPFMHGGISLHSLLVLATQETLHHKLNPCATVDSITCFGKKINQNIISCWTLKKPQGLTPRGLICHLVLAFMCSITLFQVSMPQVPFAFTPTFFWKTLRESYVSFPNCPSASTPSIA